MWASRHQLVGMDDVLGVPREVRQALGFALPPAAFTLYRASEDTVVGVSNADAVPYEIYATHAAALDFGGVGHGVLRALVASRDRHAALTTTLLPTGADGALPLCRDVWAKDAACALDILYPATYPRVASPDRPCFPMLVNVVAYDGEAAAAGDFATPVAVRTNVTLTFDRGDGEQLSSV